MSIVDRSVYLIRHGEAAASWGLDADPGLSELGYEQAENVAESMLEELRGATKPIRLVTSPLKRARQTSTPLQRDVGRSILVESRFGEIPTPVPLVQRQQWLRSFMEQHWPEQRDDSLLNWRADTVNTLNSLFSPAVIFTHFMVINSIVAHVLGRSETVVFWPANTSVTRLTATENGLEITSLGEEMEGRKSQIL